MFEKEDAQAEMHKEGRTHHYNASDEHEPRLQGSTKQTELDSDEEEAPASVEQRASVVRQGATMHHAHAQAASQQADAMSRLVMQNQVPLAAMPLPSQHRLPQGQQMVAPGERCMRFYTEERNSSCA